MARTERHLTRDDDDLVRDRDEIVVNHDRDQDPVVVHDDDGDRMLRDPDVRRRIVQEELVRHGVVQPRAFGNVPATAGLTLGLAAVAVGWVPALFPFAALFGVVGLALAIAGRKRAALDERTGRGRAMAGIVFSVVGIALAVVGFLVVADVINTFDGTIADVWDELRDVDAELSDSLGS